MEKKKAFVVATSHLDTVWRWSIADTVEKFIPDTLTKNFDLLEKYPNYRFNFEGAYRYELIEEFYPKAFEIIKQYADEDRWCVSGSAYENGDVNIPSPEALFRNILIGNNYFKEKLGKKSEDLFLPDCFGFGLALPSVISNAGLKGFTTQKLSWGSAYGLPFDLGIWRGPDGKCAYTCLNAKSYRYKFSGDIRADVSVIDRIADNASKANLPWANHLYGTGDWGGAPTEESVKAVNESVKTNDNEDFDVISATSDEIFKNLDKLSKEEKNQLPIWDNELLMTSHGAGCYTSRCMSKRLDFQAEQTADLAEPFCCLAHYNGLYEYPKENLRNAWKNTIKHQFHDDITGTSTMEVYNESWNDYYNSISQFRSEFSGAATALSKGLDTSWIDRNDVALVVFNPTQYARCESVKAKVLLKKNAFYVKVTDASGKEVPSQVAAKKQKELDIVFQAEMKPYECKVYSVGVAEAPYSKDTGLKLTNHSLENYKFRIVFNRNGDIAKLYDKELGKDIISSPIKMALLHDTGELSYPSWEMRKEDIDKEPYCYANTPKFEIYENGAARISIRITREADYSTITQIVSLTPTSEYVEVYNMVDWRTRRTMLKATFPLASSNEYATYDLGLGVISRGNNTENLYEVPAQHWADITDRNEDFGVSVLSDSKHGWDKPTDNTLRLTCIHTPAGAFTKDARQDLQDLGRNMFSFAVYSHKNGFENGTQKQSILFNNPLRTVEIQPESDCQFDSSMSLFSISDDDVIVRAVKMSEDDDSLIIRVNEGSGKEHKNVTITLSALEISKAQIVNSSEEILSNIKADKRSIKFNIKPFEVKTFKIQIKYTEKADDDNYKPVSLTFNAKGFTEDSNMRHVILQGSGYSLPIELLPEKHIAGGIPFEFTQKADDLYDVLVSRGQTVKFDDDIKAVYILAATVNEKKTTETFITGNKKNRLNIFPMAYPICKWDMYGMNQKADVNHKVNYGFEFTHTHHPEGNTTRKALFNVYKISLGKAHEIELPEDNKLIILAMTASKSDRDAVIRNPFIDLASSSYEFGEIPPIERIIEKGEAVTIRAGKIQDQMKSGKGKGFKRDNIITNIIRSYTKSEW